MNDFDHLKIRIDNQVYIVTEEEVKDKMYFESFFFLMNKIIFSIIPWITIFRFH